MSDIGPVPFTAKHASEPLWQLVQRIADSPHFRKGPKLRGFLLYVCENAILGRTENLTAQLIGTKVFGRSPQCDMSEDNIVRVEARELRKRLDAYFSAEGRDEPVIIQLPKGSYAPVFVPRNGAQVRQPESDAAGTGPVPAEPAGAKAAPRISGRLLVLGLIAVAAIALWAAARYWPPNWEAIELACYGDLLGDLGLAPNRETLLVLGNPQVILYYGSESELKTGEAEGRVRAPQELKQTFGFALRGVDKNLPHQYLWIVKDDFTGIGEAVAGYHLGRLLQRLGRQNRLTQSRFLNWDHVQKQDLILLGGPASNDWSYQDDARSNFHFVRGGIANRNPLPGESAFYSDASASNPAPARSEYGVLKMLTSPYGFRTLLLAGVSSAGTAGVAEFFSTPEKMSTVAKRIRANLAGKPFPSDWEVLVRISVRSALPVETSIIAVRPSAGKAGTRPN